MALDVLRRSAVLVRTARMKTAPAIGRLAQVRQFRVLSVDADAEPDLSARTGFQYSRNESA
ncbi:hypothetical protein [Nocardia fluminea]|uniref:hypothetical protein n=1 Tax=Nocardia fluminea TaxID=134984 RepID=UPI003D0CE4FD